MTTINLPNVAAPLSARDQAIVRRALIKSGRRPANMTPAQLAQAYTEIGGIVIGPGADTVPAEPEKAATLPEPKKPEPKKPEPQKSAQAADGANVAAAISAAINAALAGFQPALDQAAVIDLIKQHAQLQKRAAQAPVVTPVPSQLDIDTSVIDTYDRMVDKVRTMEAQAEALAELAEMDDLEEEFRKLEKSAAVESELKAMKDKTQA